MEQAILEGISTGLVFSARIGLVFFSQVQGSSTHGFKYAVGLATGVLTSDIFQVLVTYIGFQLLAEIACFCLLFPCFSRSSTIIFYRFFHRRLSVLNRSFKQIQLVPFPCEGPDFMHQIEGILLSSPSQLSLRLKEGKVFFGSRHQ